MVGNKTSGNFEFNTDSYENPCYLYGEFIHIVLTNKGGYEQRGVKTGHGVSSSGYYHDPVAGRGYRMETSFDYAVLLAIC